MTCGKRRIPTREDAARILAAIWSRQHAGKLPVRAYRCNECHGGFHLTSWSLAEYKAELTASRFPVNESV